MKHFSDDVMHAATAEDHARTAWMCAVRADHNLLRAWVRATQHTAAFWQANYEVAAEHAIDGLRYAGTGTAELFLSNALALDLARAGNVERAEEALRRAQQVAETVVRAEDELAGPLTCSRRPHARVTVSAVSLINLNRDRKAYEWTDVASVPFGSAAHRR